MQQLTIYKGTNKDGLSEPFESITFTKGNIYSIVGNTGSGKSRLIKDIEQFAHGDSITKRSIEIDGQLIPMEERNTSSMQLISHLSQNMRFVLDATVEEFLNMHKACRNKEDIDLQEIIECANTITQEPISLTSDLNALSGGQTRALMIADIAIICDNPIILIDEIENAGIDKNKALDVLLKKDKLIFIVTHDPHTALLGSKRIIMENGSIKAVIDRTSKEEETLNKLKDMYEFQLQCQTLLRKGDHIHENS